VTITQMQALRAARNAGIVVPKEIIDKGTKYLKESTAEGGVIYSLSQGDRTPRPALTAAAVSCAFNAGDYNSPLVKEWLKFCQKNIPLSSSAGMARFGHDEYVHYYFAQTLYMLGDDGYAKLFPNSRESERLTWSKYRKDAFANLKATQNPDGSWGGN